MWRSVRNRRSRHPSEKPEKRRTRTSGSDDSAAESSLTQNHPQIIGRNDSAAESATSAESSRQVVRNTRPTKHRAEREARSKVRGCSVRSQVAGQGREVKKCCKTQHIRRVHRSVRSRWSRHPSEKPTKIGRTHTPAESVPPRRSRVSQWTHQK